MNMMASPCEKICTIDAGSGLCSGCGRSLEEIEHWLKTTDTERARIIQELPGRLEAMALRRAARAPRP